MVMGSTQVTREASVTSASASANMDLNSSTPTLVGELPHLHLPFLRIGLLVALVQIKASPIRRNASPFAMSTSVSQCMLAVRKVLLRANVRMEWVEQSTGLAMLSRITYLREHEKGRAYSSIEYCSCSCSVVEEVDD